MHTPIAAGFTLLEALVGIAIAGLVMAMLGVSFRFSIDEWEREQQRDKGGVHAAVRLLAMQLASYDPVAQGGGDARFLSLQGSSHQLVFPTFVSLRSLHGGAPVLVCYLFDDSTLHYSEMPLDNATSEAVRLFIERPGADVSRLEIPAAEFSISYHRSRDRGRSSDWPHVAELPEAVVCRYRPPGDSSPSETALFPLVMDFSGLKPRGQP